MAEERLSEAFVRHYSYLRERTRNDPREISRALAEHSDLAASVKKLGEIFREVDQRRKTSRRRVISTSNPKFYEALRDFEKRWVSAYNEFRKRVFAEAALEALAAGEIDAAAVTPLSVGYYNLTHQSQRFAIVPPQ